MYFSKKCTSQMDAPPMSIYYYCHMNNIAYMNKFDKRVLTVNKKHQTLAFRDTTYHRCGGKKKKKKSFDGIKNNQFCTRKHSK